jgi:MoxR-like ATPase
MKFKPEQLNPDAPLPIEETTDTVSYLGVELKKGSGGDRVPNPKQFENDIITDFDLKLMQRVAVALSLNQPVLVESGSGIGKSQMVDRICHDLNRECYYANCHDYDADTLIGSQTSLEGTTSGFGWKDGVIIEAARKGGILFLDEYNFMRGDTRGRLHEVLDTILRGKGEIALTENHNEIVKVHPDFRVVAAQNPPGGEYGDREVLDPAQIDRFVYIKEKSKLYQKRFVLPDYLVAWVWTIKLPYPQNFT